MLTAFPYTGNIAHAQEETRLTQSAENKGVIKVPREGPLPSLLHTEREALTSQPQTSF